MGLSLRGRPLPRSVGVLLGIVSALVGIPGLSAAELVMRDLQADLLVRPTSFDFTLDSPNFTRSGNDNFDAGTALELGGRYSFSRVGDPFGLVIGLDAVTEAYSYDSEDFLVAYGARAVLGAGYAFTDSWTATAEVGAAFGWTDLSLPASESSAAITADGDYQAYDLRLVALYTITRRMLLSVQAGYVAQTHDLTTNQGDRLTVDLAGVYVGVGMTWRFSNSPERVE
jgi:hypothetical protein